MQPRVRRLDGALIALCFFALLVPTLSFQRFRDIIERINIDTAMEIRWDRNWLTPTLMGAPRLAKPPLPAWVTAAAIRSSTLADLRNPDPVVRKAALRRLAFESRLPVAIALCAMLIAVYELGRLVASPSVGMWSAIIAGTSLIFLVQVRNATLDAYLALGVAVTNVFLAHAVIERRRSAIIAAGAALGFAFMCKGPLSLIQTVVPFAAFVVWRRWSVGRVAENYRVPRGAVAAAIALFVIIGLWWYAVVAIKFSSMGLGKFWLGQITQYQDDGIKPDPWFEYIRLMRLFQPWLVWLVVGAAAAIVQVIRISRAQATAAASPSDARPDPRPRDARWALPIFLLIVPLFLMSFGKIIKARYVLPVTPPVAVIAAMAIAPYFHRRREHPREIGTTRPWYIWPRFPIVAHWVLVFGFTIGTLITITWRTEDPPDPAPFTIAQMLPLALSTAAAIAAGIWLTRRRGAMAMILTSAAAMLFSNSVYAYAEGKRPDDRGSFRESADVIFARCPDAVIYTVFPEQANVLNVAAVNLELYASRTVRWSAQWPDPTKHAEPTVVMIHHPRKDGLPNPPEGWGLLDRVIDRKTITDLYVHPPELAPAPPAPPAK